MKENNGITVFENVIVVKVLARTLLLRDIEETLGDTHPKIDNATFSFRRSWVYVVFSVKELQDICSMFKERMCVCVSLLSATIGTSKTSTANYERSLVINN